MGGCFKPGADAPSAVTDETTTGVTEMGSGCETAGGSVTVTGSAGLRGHVPGAAMTVSALARASGGLRPGGLIETATDRRIYKHRR